MDHDEQILEDAIEGYERYISLFRSRKEEAAYWRPETDDVKDLSEKHGLWDLYDKLDQDSQILFDSVLAKTNKSCSDVLDGIWEGDYRAALGALEAMNKLYHEEGMLFPAEIVETDINTEALQDPAAYLFFAADPLETAATHLASAVHILNRSMYKLHVNDHVKLLTDYPRFADLDVAEHTENVSRYISSLPEKITLDNMLEFSRLPKDLNIPNFGYNENSYLTRLIGARKSL